MLMPTAAAAGGAAGDRAPAATTEAVCLMSGLEQLNMVMLLTTLPHILEEESHPGRWGLIYGAATAVALASGSCLGRRTDTGDLPQLLLRAVVLTSAASFLLGVGNKLQSVELMVGGALLCRVR